MKKKNPNDKFTSQTLSRVFFCKKLEFVKLLKKAILFYHHAAKIVIGADGPGNIMMSAH